VDPKGVWSNSIKWARIIAMIDKGSDAEVRPLAQATVSGSIPLRNSGKQSAQ